MAVNIDIKQANQIGGCITIISTDKTKIVVDFGENLPGSERKANIKFDWENEKVDAVFFTHYHGDHIGRFMEIPDDVPLYMGEVTYKVMMNIRVARRDYAAVRKLRNRYNNDKLFFIEQNSKIVINNDIAVTGYGIDHSAFDAYMFLIQADGTNILHTGDFRDHGHRGHKIRNGVDHNIMLDVINKHVLLGGRRQVDILITEGTMMGERANDERFSEADLQKWASDYFDTHRHIFLKVSSTNVDTLASFYHAAKSKGMKMYANSYILKQFKVYRDAGRKHNTYMYDFGEAEQIPFISDKEGANNTEAYRTLDEMRENGFIAIVAERDYYERIMDELSDTNPQLIYSMWDGYLDPDRDAYNEELYNFYHKYNAISKHTSGHAYPDFIAEMINTVNPVKELRPIHTENAKGFENLPIRDEIKERIVYSEQDKIDGILTEDVIKTLLKRVSERDHRAVNDSLAKAFADENGSLYEFKKFVLKHNGQHSKPQEKLAVLLRGNGNKIIIYLNNHKLWELSLSGSQGKVSFDYDHARYCENWKDTLDELTDEDGGYGFVLTDRRNDDIRFVKDTPIVITRNSKGQYNGGSIGMISCKKDSFSSEFVEGTFKIFSKLIDSFFDKQSTDYYRKEVREELEEEIKKDPSIGEGLPARGNEASILLEKRWQHRFFFEFKNTEDGYYVYDLEFSQPYPSKYEIIDVLNEKRGDNSGEESYNKGAKTKEIKKRVKANEPDMLAVRFEGGIPKALVFIEVKCTFDACKGDSGIVKHLDGMNEYAGGMGKDIFIKSRLEDAKDSLEQYKEFGLMSPKLNIPDLTGLPVERLLILTANKDGKEEGSAIEYYKKYKWIIDKHLKGCRIMMIKSAVCQDEIIISDPQDIM